MALPKRHWGNAAQSPGFVPDAACGRSRVREIITTSALAFDVRVSRNTDWYCSDCAKAARIALAKESAPEVVVYQEPRPVYTPVQSTGFGPVVSTRPSGVRTDSDRYAELRALVEAWQTARSASERDRASIPQAVSSVTANPTGQPEGWLARFMDTCAAETLLADWSHR